jgi:hypothetical protein
VESLISLGDVDLEADELVAAAEAELDAELEEELEEELAEFELGSTTDDD